MDIDIRDFAADHYAEANKRPPSPEIEAYIKAYDARRQADADARDAPTLRWDKTAGGLYTDHSRSPNGDPRRAGLGVSTARRRRSREITLAIACARKCKGRPARLIDHRRHILDRYRQLLQSAV